MSRRTIYTCEKCGHEQETSEQFWYVGVTASCYPNDYEARPLKQIEVCRSCLESFGIHVQKKLNETIPVPPTNEELIVDLITRIAQQAVFEAQGISQ